MAVNDVITQTNTAITSKFSGFFTGSLMYYIGWGIAILILIVGLWYIYYSYKQKKLWNRQIIVDDIVGDYFIQIDKDKAKPVKIGSGGFQVLFLKKYKAWKLAYGGRVGKNTHEFYIMPDGYWYSGMKSANLKWIDANKGLIPVITTHPSMRGQYTSLEKQIDDLHKDKKSFWDQYGTWIMSIAFLVIAGVFLWLNYQEFVKATANLSSAITEIGKLIDKLNILQGNSNVSNGLIPVR